MHRVLHAGDGRNHVQTPTRVRSLCRKMEEQRREGGTASHAHTRRHLPRRNARGQDSRASPDRVSVWRPRVWSVDSVSMSEQGGEHMHDRCPCSSRASCWPCSAASTPCRVPTSRAPRRALSCPAMRCADPRRSPPSSCPSRARPTRTATIRCDAARAASSTFAATSAASARFCRVATAPCRVLYPRETRPGASGGGDREVARDRRERSSHGIVVVRRECRVSKKKIVARAVILTHPQPKGSCPVCPRNFASVPSLTAPNA